MYKHSPLHMPCPPAFWIIEALRFAERAVTSEDEDYYKHDAERYSGICREYMGRLNVPRRS